MSTTQKKIKISQAVILAGGKGKRLRPYTLTIPKPMVEINGKPFLEYLIRDLKKNGITEIVILVGYLHNKIEKYFGVGKSFGVSILYSYSPVEADTGLRIRNAKKLIKSGHFLLLYGDNFCPLDIEELSNFFVNSKKRALVTVYSNFDLSTKNNVYIDQGIVKVYDRSRQSKNLNGVEIGYFILDSTLLVNLPSDNFSFEEKLMNNLIAEKQLAGFVTNHKYYSLTNSQRIPAIQEYFSKKKVVMLDRDGVINIKPSKADYVTSWDKFTFLPRSLEALDLISKKEYEIIILTNQAGIARGLITGEQLGEIHTNLKNILLSCGIKISGIYVCPHGWNEGCWCRKPLPGLFFKAAAERKFNLFDAIYIGDDERDQKAALSAHCRYYQVRQKQDLFDIVSKYL